MNNKPTTVSSTDLDTPDRLIALILTFLLSFGLVSSIQAVMFETDTFKITADFRLRAEQDWNPDMADGASREDRARMRVRARIAMSYQANDTFPFATRLRSGADDSQQSPHITIIDFDGNDNGDANFNFDKW